MATINLHFGDSLAAMRAMPDQCYDLAIVDPPYGVAQLDTFRGPGGDKPIAVEMKKRILAQQVDKMRAWDIVPPPEYFAELRRVSKQQIIWGGNYFDLPPTRCVLCWDKVQPWPNYSQIEMAWTSYTKTAKLFRFDNRTGGKIHPTQKPVELYQWCLEHFAQPGDRILDTHLGSGSIAIACHNMGYDLDAWELDPEYHAAAVARFTKHTQQLQLPW